MFKRLTLSLVGQPDGKRNAQRVGVFQRDGTFDTVDVGRGIGNSIIPFRINNRPEVVLIELATP